MSIRCGNYRNAFEELLDGTIGTAMKDELECHMETCVDCRQRLAEERAIRRELACLPSPPMRAEFPVEIMARLRQTRTVQVSRWGFAAGFGSAVAAGLVLWFVVSLTTVPHQTAGGMQTVALTLGQVEKINLVFDSPEEFGQTSFALVMPENAELEGYPGKHELTWTASLRKGKNRLVLPIRVLAPGDGEIVARISQSDDVKIFRLRLNVHSQSGASPNSGTVTWVDMMINDMQRTQA